MILLLVAASGLIHGVRTARAQCLYFGAKYGPAREDVPGILTRCADAHRLYPFNYFAAIWAAEKAYYSRGAAGPEQEAERLEAAQQWCDLGLHLNPHKSQLRLLKTRLLQRDSPRQAARYWERYVDWQFWNPHNHAVLVELYARAGEFERAMATIQRLKGRPHHDEAKRHLEEAWAREMGAPPVVTLPSARANRD
jgi:hypothetical protein